jgi:hypothetical protein
VSRTSHKESLLRSSGAGEFIHAVADATLDNPIPAALLGVGIAWVLSREIWPSFAPTRAAMSKQSHAADRARARVAQRGVSEYLGERPLLLGAVGFAMGAGLATLLPITAVEGEMLAAKAEWLATESKSISGAKGTRRSGGNAPPQ